MVVTEGDGICDNWTVLVPPGKIQIEKQTMPGGQTHLFPHLREELGGAAASKSNRNNGPSRTALSPEPGTSQVSAQEAAMGIGMLCRPDSDKCPHPTRTHARLFFFHDNRSLPLPIFPIGRLLSHCFVGTFTLQAPFPSSFCHQDSWLCGDPTDLLPSHF